MTIKEIRRYAELVSAGHGNEKERLAPMEAHRANVIAKLAEVQEHLKLIDTRSTSTEAGSRPATPTGYGRPTAWRTPASRA
jgi:DNA-binding transcriptional MerR regulator